MQEINLVNSNNINLTDFTDFENHIVITTDSSELGKVTSAIKNNKHIITIGCGDLKKFTKEKYAKVINIYKNYLQQFKNNKILVLLATTNISDANSQFALEYLILKTNDFLYTFDKLKTEKNPNYFNNVTFVSSETDHVDTNRILILANSTNYLRDLGNIPANICNPEYLANEAEQMSKTHKKVKTTVYDESKLKKMGMETFCSVSQGSDNDGKMVVMTYNNSDSETKPTIFVGKGITFDTGGYSLKPRDAMLGMKFDMLGAATVLSLMKAAAELELPVNIVGIMICAENMVSGHASRVNDIVKSLSGITVEITNTDAEGRLVLSDALTYAQQNFEPKEIIDLATLTGAIVVALGHDATGVFSNNDDLAERILKASNKTFDRAWRLPIWESYDDHLKSLYADILNAHGKPESGSIVAAKFLQRFIKNDLPWCHLDIAGSAFDDKGATGRPLTMLLDFLNN